MNKGRILGGLLLLTACGKKEVPSAAVPTDAPAAVRILAFGDSLTAGKDLPDPETQAYPAALERLLKNKGYSVEVLNAGRSGDTTSDALARMDFHLADRPDLAIVALGSNDTFQGKSLASIERNLDALLRGFQKANVPVILVEMKTFPNLGPSYAGGYERLFPRLARRRQARLAPFFLRGVAAVPSLNLGDGIHPNAAGAERMAANLLPTVERALKSLGKGSRE